MAKGKKRKMTEINASSMADISFLLLIFFLVTTSMDTTTGLARRLPPPLPPEMEKPSVDIKERDLFVVVVNNENQLLVQGELLEIGQLREKTKEFIKNEFNNPYLPVLYTENFPHLGTIDYTKDHVISVRNHVDTQYQAYLDAQSEIVGAYNDLRNELAVSKFGKTFYELDEDRQKEIQTVYPQRISEAEPKNYGGGN